MTKTSQERAEEFGSKIGGLVAKGLFKGTKKVYNTIKDTKEKMTKHKKTVPEKLHLEKIRRKMKYLGEESIKTIKLIYHYRKRMDECLKKKYSEDDNCVYTFYYDDKKNENDEFEKIKNWTVSVISVLTSIKDKMKNTLDIPSIRELQMIELYISDINTIMNSQKVLEFNWKQVRNKDSFKNFLNGILSPIGKMIVEGTKDVRKKIKNTYDKLTEEIVNSYNKRIDKLNKNVFGGKLGYTIDIDDSIEISQDQYQQNSQEYHKFY